MKKVVVYKSRTGFTKRYAEWIGEALACEVVDYNKLKTLAVDDIDVIIYGSRVHAGMIDSLSKVKDYLKDKKCKLVVFATGATPIEAKQQIENIVTANFSGDNTPFFYMQSGLCYEKMGVADKLIMKMLSKMLASKEDKSDAENGTATAISKSHDISSKEYIMPLIDFVQNQL